MSFSVDEHVAHRVARTTTDDWKRISEGLTRKFSGEIHLPRTGTCLRWRAEREANAILVFALDPRVDDIEVIPEHVTLMLDGKRRDWYPALRVTKGRQVVMVDIVRDRTIEMPGRSELTERLTWIYSRRGIHYSVITESQVKKQPRLDNAKLIFGYSGIKIEPDTELAVVGELVQGVDTTLGYLESKLDGVGEIRATVFAMANKGQIALDLWARDLSEMSVKLIRWEGLQ